MKDTVHIGRLWGAIFLIAGTTIGGAMLALPVTTGRAGLIPSILTMVFCWLYLTVAAFYILEVNLALPAHSNLISMAERTLGKWGKAFSWVFYLFLLYALNTAYIAATTSIFASILEKTTGMVVSHFLCVLPLLVFFGILLRQGMRFIDGMNRIFMVGLIVTFITLLAFSLPHMNVEYFTVYNMKYVWISLSTVVTAFGFHIVIPTLVSYLHGDVKKMKIAIWVGSALPLVAYILWQIAILGFVPMEIVQNPELKNDAVVSILEAYDAGINATDLLAKFTQHPWIAPLSTVLALCVILTSFIGVSVSLFDFLADGLKMSKTTPKNKWKLFFFAFVPPLYFALTSPRAFYTALEYAGAFGVVILLALIPALMVLRKRYSLRLPSPYRAPGGKFGLILFILISLAIIAIECVVKLKVVPQ